MSNQLTVLELCAGGGGQALGLGMAGFSAAGVVEIEPRFCATLQYNRPAWNVIQADLRSFQGKPFEGVDLVAGGVPCPPFSIAGKQLGEDDERNLFPEALRIVKEANPRAVLLENVPGFASLKFADYREWLAEELERLGYRVFTNILNASDHGVPQLRPRFILVVLKQPYAEYFFWPEKRYARKSVGETLLDLMAAKGWPHAGAWAEKAGDIGPTLVGGSTKHGGPDLGPTRARAKWAELGVDGAGITEEAPGLGAPRNHMPKLTVRMAARIQGFPDEWIFTGKKTIAYRQIGNAFPPPVAEAIGVAIKNALQMKHGQTAATKKERLEAAVA